MDTVIHLQDTPDDDFHEVGLHSPNSTTCMLDHPHPSTPLDCWHTFLAWIIPRHRAAVHASPYEPC